MTYQNIVAFIPELTLQKVEKELRKKRVPDLYVSKVHGFGEYKNLYKNDCMDDCIRVEIFCKEEIAKEIAEIIHDAVHSGLRSDGFVAIQPVDEFINISK